MLVAGDMSRPAPEILLSSEEKETLLRWMRSSKSEQRMVQRARVILLAASGLDGKQIAAKMKTRAARVSKWLRRFATERIAALNDGPRRTAGSKLIPTYIFTLFPPIAPGSIRSNAGLAS